MCFGEGKRQIKCRWRPHHVNTNGSVKDRISVGKVNIWDIDHFLAYCSRLFEHTYSPNFLKII